ncbi:MAG: hypothetical protein IPN76_05875 [Saprospiraceae bacterium]|nr:hypothetical protein [Saprospiraceae bacterium]
MNDLLYKVALTKIPMVGAVTAKVLVSYCGGPREVFSTKKTELMRIPGIGEIIANNVLDPAVMEEAEKEVDFLIKHGIKPIFYLQKDYPQRLRNLSDAPVMLYYSGNADLNCPAPSALSMPYAHLMALVFAKISWKGLPPTSR